MHSASQIPVRLGRPSTVGWSHYVAMGDSLSEGLGDPLEGGRVRGWATLLAARLREQNPRLAFTNLAVRGHTASRALRRQLPVAERLRPDLVSVFVGGNDVLLRPSFEPARFAAQLDALVRPFASGEATVVLSTLPDLTACSPLVPPWRTRLRRRIESANDVIRAQGERHGAVLLDAWADPRTRQHGMWSVDRIHPSQEGHRLIASSVADLLGLPGDAEEPTLTREPWGRLARRHAREAAWLVRHGVRRLT